jgi:hypothetical protein
MGVNSAIGWYRKAIKIIKEIDKTIKIACPFKTKNDDKISQDDFIVWEKHFLEKVEKFGVVLFWLSKEFSLDQISLLLLKLGELKTHYEFKEIKIVIGIEQGFVYEDYLKSKLHQDCPDLDIYSSLREVCLQAVKLFYG